MHNLSTASKFIMLCIKEVLISATKQIGGLMAAGLEVFSGITDYTITSKFGDLKKPELPPATVIR